MATDITAFVVVAVGSGMNAAHAIQTNKDPFPTLLGGIVFGTLCVGINDVAGNNVGTLLALLFLLSSFLRNGVALLTTVDAIVNSPKG